MALEIDRLAHEDVPDALRLSTQAGWNQLAADWHRLLDLDPAGCFGGWLGDDLVATATLVAYDDDIGWIGMVLVDEDHRRNGYGSAMFDRVRRLAEDRGVAAGLDATDAGREVYRRENFVDVAPIERWSGRLSAVSGGSDPDVTDFGADDLPAVRSLDRRATGVDRTDLLEHLLAEDGTTGLVRERGDGPDGYAIVRPGREFDHVGPVIADDEAAVEALLHAAADVVGDAPVLIDVLDLESGSTTALLERGGLECQRRLTRMTYREPSPLLVGDRVVAAAGFELG